MRVICADEPAAERVKTALAKHNKVEGTHFGVKGPLLDDKQVHIDIWDMVTQSLWRDLRAIPGVTLED